MLPSPSRMVLTRGVKPLTNKQSSLRVLGVNTDLPPSSTTPCWVAWRGLTTVFYDGKCGLCSKEIDHYKKIAPQGEAHSIFASLKTKWFKVFSIGKTWHKVARSWRNEGSALPTAWGCCTLLTRRGSCTSGWTPSSSSGLSWTGGEYSGGSSPYLPLEKLQTSSIWLLRTRGSRSWNTVRLRRGKDETQ